MVLKHIDEETLALMEGCGDSTVRARVLSCAENLAERDFSVIAVPTISEANRRIAGAVGRHVPVYYWATPALEELGILETLRARGNSVKSALPLTRGRVSPRKTGQLPHDALFLSSACAITADGQLVKIQPEIIPLFQHGAGPQTIALVAGFNSIVDTLEDGFRRAKDVCVPQCAVRMGLDLPCVASERCVECDRPPSLCSVNTVIARRPTDREITVVLIGERVGL